MRQATACRIRTHPPGRRILSARADSELFFCGTETFPCHKKARPPKAPGGFQLRSRKPYKNNAMAQNKGGRPKAADPKRHIYRFRLNDEQNTRFQQMLSEAGLTDNMSKFILARLFG